MNPDQTAPLGAVESGFRVLAIQKNLSKAATEKKTQNWFSRLQIIAYCRSKALQNAPKGALCNTLDVH